MFQTSDTTTTWYFELPNFSPNGKQRSHYHRIREYLCQRVRHCVTRQDLSEAPQLLNILPQDKTFDPCSFFRFIMILVESTPSENIHKNVLFHLESLTRKLYINPTEVFVEILNYMLKNDRLEDARELLSVRHRSITKKAVKVLPYVGENIRCIDFLLNYITWERQLVQEDKKPLCDVSTQGWIVNAIELLKNTIGNYEYFVIAVTRILLFYRYHKKAYLFVSQYMRNNPMNISAQILILNLLEYLSQFDVTPQKTETFPQQYDENTMDCSLTVEEYERNRSKDIEKINNFSIELEDEMIDLKRYPIINDTEKALENLRKLDISLPLMMNYSDNRYSVYRLKDLMDGMEHLREVRNKYRWRKIRSTLEQLFEFGDQESVAEARALWRANYRLYWIDMDFVQLAGDDVSRSRKKLIRQVSGDLKMKLEG